jgi:hypothetical protein
MNSTVPHVSCSEVPSELHIICVGIYAQFVGWSQEFGLSTEKDHPRPCELADEFISQLIVISGTTPSAS